TEKPGNMSKFQEQLTQTRKTPEDARSPYQKAVVSLYQHISRYLRLMNAVDQSVLYDTFIDENQGLALLGTALQAGVFLPPSQRSDEQHQMIFSNPMLRQLDRTVNYLGTNDGHTDN